MSKFVQYNGSVEFDSELNLIPHFTLFPEMKPWIGAQYSAQKIKILIIGESHYFNKGTNFHHDPKAWYERNLTEDLSKREGHRVRYQISKGKKSHVNYRAIEKVLLESDYFRRDTPKDQTAFDSISYINYFQRPANNTGGSIKFDGLDLEVASKTIKGVVDTIKPNILLFTSIKAFRCAKKEDLFSDSSVLKDYSAHPCSPWWNRKSKKYGKFNDEHRGEISGRDRFLTALNKMSQMVIQAAPN